MIQLSELAGFDSTKYNALKAKLAAKGIDPVVKVTLRQYAPNWSAINGFAANVGRIDFAINWADFRAVYPDPNNNTALLSSTLPHGSSTWDTHTYWDSYFPLTGISIGEGVIENGVREAVHFVISNNGIKAFNIVFEGGTILTWNNATSNTVRFVAGVKSDGASAHVIGTTGNGNWRLGYCNLGATDILWSDIYWPYQVRSFSAARMNGYDVVAMVTDLPPLTDVSTSGTKTQITEQRVQGVVIFKFDPVNKTWSDHFVVDSCDNVSDVAIANVDLYVNGGYVFMTYARQHTDTIGVCLSRSSDGLNWENPLFVQDIGSYSSVSDVPKFSFVGNGEYMYLGSCHRVLRSLATDFSDTINPLLVENLTSYTTSISAQIGTQRSATVKVVKPDGYTGLLDSKKRMRCLIEFGYWDNGTALIVPILTGDVEVKASSRELPANEVTLTVKDTSSLPQAVGSSVAREWEGITFSGDNFVPTIEEDETGSSGLGHVAIKTGTWTGGDKTHKVRGLTFQADGNEGFAMSTEISRAMCGSFSGEMSFYNRIDAVAKQPGGVPETLQGGEVAALACHVLDEHNCWLVKWTPAADSAGVFTLVKRIGTVDGSTVSHRDLDPSATSSGVTYDSTYPYTYSGRITIRWHYNMIRVYRHYPNGSAQRILMYEAMGMGDLDFNAKSGGAPLYPTLEGGYHSRPLTGGGAGYMAYSPKDGYENILGDGGFEGTFTGDGSNNFIGTNVFIAQMTGILHGQSSTLKHGGTYSWQCTNPASSGDNVDKNLKCGCKIRTSPNLAIASGTIFRMKGWVKITQIDPHGDMAIFANLRQYGDLDSTRRGVVIEITEAKKWVPFSLSCTASGTIDCAEIMSYVYGYGRSTDTVWYLDDFTIEKYTGAKSYVYFGNVDVNDGLHAFSANDAIDAMYAYAGHHHMARHYAMNEALSSSYSSASVDLPYIANFTVTGTSGKIGLCSWGESPSPIEIDWTTNETKITVKSLTGIDGVRRIPATLPTGQVRVMVTTQRNEGTLFKNDQSGVQDWITVAIYSNERLHMCHSFALYDRSVLGSRIYASAGAISNVKVDELHRQVPFFSVDPGEVVSAGMGRIVGQSRSETVYRFNDTVLFARPIIVHNPASVDWALPLSRTAKIDESETGQIPVHYRLVGAWDELDIFDEDGMNDTWRHIFTRKDDPNLLTAAELETERAYVLYELQAARDRQSVEIAFNPLMEHGDYMSFDGKYWTFDSASLSLSANNDGVLQMSSSLVLNGA